MDRNPATTDQRIAKIAERQHGVLTIEQLRACGASDDAVKGRTRSGRLFRIHRGVYAPGHAQLSHEGRWMAAVLACGGVLSHRSAAALWRLLPPKAGFVDVSVAGDGGREQRKGIRVHRSRTLTPALATSLRGIPVTRPARTIADLRKASTCGAASPRELRRAIRQAAVLGLPIEAEAAHDRTRSELEHLFLAPMPKAPSTHPGGQRLDRLDAGRFPMARPTVDRGDGRLPIPPGVEWPSRKIVAAI